MRKMHKLGPHDGGHFAPSTNGYSTKELDPEKLLKELNAKLFSKDPEDRRDAARAAYLLERCIWCPDGVWVCETAYAKDRNGDRWSENHVIWSAHLTKAEALKWHVFWSKHWKGHGYERLPVRQANQVPLSYLRHPKAAVGQGTRSW